jgi:hypothetical protein
MSTRERWIVYPLLLLALGAALRPKYVPPEMVACHRLVIVDEENRPRIVLGMSERTSEAEIQVLDNERRPLAQMRSDSAAHSGVFQVLSREGRSLVTVRSDPASRAGLIETQTIDGELQTMLTSSDTGGEIIAYDVPGHQAIGIGYRGGQSGLSLTDLNSHNSLFVPIPKLLR